GKQAVAGQTELDEIRQLGFRQRALFVLGVEAVIDQQAVNILDFANDQFPAIEMGDFIAGSKAHTGQRSTAQSVLTRIAGGRVEHGKQAAVLSEDGAEPQLCFAVADPALPRLILLLRHACLRRVKKPGMVPEARWVCE